MKAFTSVSRRLGGHARPFTPLFYSFHFHPVVGMSSSAQQASRPPNPYRAKQAFDIRRVVPTYPFLPQYWAHAPQSLRYFISNERAFDLASLTTQTGVASNVLQKPLPCASTDELATLRIEEELVVQDGRGAQIVACQISTFDDNAKPLVAKIYDPLYYPSHEPGVPENIWDPIRYADADFTAEAAAYTHLEPLLGGAVVPHYYGSWALSLSLDGQQRRVHLSLLERIHGVVLSSIDPKTCTRKERLNMVCKIMEAEHAMLYLGVTPYDMASRNIMVCGNGAQRLSDPQLEIRVIDLASTSVDVLQGREPLYTSAEKLPSPAEHYRNAYVSGFPEWFDDLDLEDWWNDYLVEHWRGDERYLPVDE